MDGKGLELGGGGEGVSMAGNCGEDDAEDDCWPPLSVLSLERTAGVTGIGRRLLDDGRFEELPV